MVQSPLNLMGVVTIQEQTGSIIFAQAAPTFQVTKWLAARLQARYAHCARSLRFAPPLACQKDLRNAADRLFHRVAPRLS
jgi:hypothetical protein